MSELLVDGEPIDYSGLPENLRAGVRRYIESGVRPGSFLSSVIRNDLRMAVQLGDDDMTLCSLRKITIWFYNHAPPTSYGSAERMKSWIDGESYK